YCHSWYISKSGRKKHRYHDINYIFQKVPAAISPVAKAGGNSICSKLTTGLTAVLFHLLPDEILICPLFYIIKNVMGNLGSKIGNKIFTLFQFTAGHISNFRENISNISDIKS